MEIRNILIITIVISIDLNENDEACSWKRLKTIILKS